MTLLDSAVSLAARGVAVFPCGPDKAPRVTGGFHSATTDEATLRAWNWNSGAMIGAVIPDGQIVVDIDPRNGGDETIALFEKLPLTRRVQTVSGGTHLYFTVPEGIALRAQLGPGVDIKRPNKGYVIVPPSEGYRYLRQRKPAPAPDWLLAELTVDAERKQGEAANPKYFGFEKGTAYGMAALERELGRLITAETGGRNETLNKAAFSLAQLSAGGELEYDHAREELATTAELAGLERDEIVKTIDSGWVAGEQEPRQAPTPERVTAGLDKLFSRPPVFVDETNFWVDWTQDEPDLPFLCWPLLPKNAYVLVYGATEASKSMAWVGLLAQGSHYGVKTSVYSLENPPATDRQRVRRWRPVRENFRLTNEHLDCRDQAQVEALIEREKAWGTDVIMIDTYSHAFTSYSDDGNAKAIAFAQVIRYVMTEVGASVIVVDHTGYMQADEPRDASAKRQQVDVAILMKKAGIWVPGEAARFTMDNKKASRFANPFFYTGEIHDLRIDEFKALELKWQANAPTWVSA